MDTGHRLSKPDSLKAHELGVKSTERETDVACDHLHFPADAELAASCDDDTLS